ncbi:MAG: DUF2497 domain-containing protein [Janthinobacterium lividum]
MIPPETPPDTAPDRAGMDEIMASIRRIVTDAPAEPDDNADDWPIGSAPPQAAASPAAAPQATPQPVAGGGVTLDAFLRSMLEPMLRTWLDANLPEIVEAATRAEIARLTGHG